jgi:hypothetical protein
MVGEQGDGSRDDGGGKLLKGNGRPVRRWLSIVPFVVLATLHNRCGTRPSQPLPFSDKVRRAVTQLEAAGPKIIGLCTARPATTNCQADALSFPVTVINNGARWRESRAIALTSRLRPDIFRLPVAGGVYHQRPRFLQYIVLCPREQMIL